MGTVSDEVRGNAHPTTEPSQDDAALLVAELNAIGFVGEPGGFEKEDRPWLLRSREQPITVDDLVDIIRRARDFIAVIQKPEHPGVAIGEDDLVALRTIIALMPPIFYGDDPYEREEVTVLKAIIQRAEVGIITQHDS